MKQFNIISLALTFLIAFSTNGQQRIEKTSQSVKANKDVTLNLDTNHTNIVIDTWNRGEVKVEAYIESKTLSIEELKDVLENWDVEVKGSGANISISANDDSMSSWNYKFDFDGEALEALQELQFVMSDLPEMPEMPEIPEMPEMYEIPEMPEIPELPELREGVHKVNFDFDIYKKEGEPYLERWSKEYEEKYGKEYKDKMKVWAKKFAKTDFDKYSKEMEVWGEKFGEKYGKDYEAKMEVWSKKFDSEWAKKMEDWGKKYEEKFGPEFEAKMEEKAKIIEERLAQNEKRLQAHEVELEKRIEARENRSEQLKKRLESSRRGKVIKTIKLRMPKDAKLKVNVRHGELKVSSVIHGLKADLSHSTFLAENIDGSITSINASYSPVFVTNWKAGNLKLNYVEHAELKLVNNLNLTSNSSNLNVGELTGNAIIVGSFGDLDINKISNSFNNLNLDLENTDAVVVLPKTDINLQMDGTYSTFQHPNKAIEESSSFSTDDLSSGKTIAIKAKYSDVVLQ